MLQQDYRRTDIAVVLFSLAALLLWDASGWDLVVVRWFGSPDGFVWRDHWLTSKVLHDGGRLLAWSVLALLVVDATRLILPAGPSRRARWRWIITMLVCVALIPEIKHFSNTSCPWELAEFGGTTHFVSHWHWGVSDLGPGHCFPSGHASSAFAFFGMYFLWRHHRPVLAQRWLMGVLLAGVLLGWAQLARGAHYPSHTYWTAWLCWTTCVIADHSL